MTRPSAGLTTAPDVVVQLRSGSRKKYTTNTVKKAEKAANILGLKAYNSTLNKMPVKIKEKPSLATGHLLFTREGSITTFLGLEIAEEYIFLSDRPLVRDGHIIFLGYVCQRPCIP